LGAHIVLDNFGTGYSSLACLCRLPLDVLKIHRAFIGDLPADDTAAGERADMRFAALAA
jgi:EAL domain-containing protein (putative c-di-GMP-specific phosphodiesterase class I)